MTHPSEQGMILVNVLLFVAIAAGIVMLMLSAEDIGLERALKMREADQAQAIAYGAELSAVTALRRDVRVAPHTDNAAEPWAALAERAAPIRGGRFDLAIADAQGRFNLNNLMSGDVEPVEILDRIAAALGLEPEVAVAVTEYIRLHGPIADLAPLTAARLDPQTEARLVSLVTVLPRETPINVNAANERLLAILLDDPIAARALIDQRQRAGSLVPEDLASKTSLPNSIVSFTSDFFWVRTRVAIGETQQQLTSLIVRNHDEGHAPSVVVMARWRGNAGPDLGDDFAFGQGLLRASSKPP